MGDFRRVGMRVVAVQASLVWTIAVAIAVAVGCFLSLNYLRNGGVLSPFLLRMLLLLVPSNVFFVWQCHVMPARQTL